MQKPHDDSKASLTAFVQDSTLTVVIEMSLRSWLVAGMVPGVNREPRKKIAPDPEVLLLLLYRWRDEAIKAGKEITRIAVAYETGRDGFWLARWLRALARGCSCVHAVPSLASEPCTGSTSCRNDRRARAGSRIAPPVAVDQLPHPAPPPPAFVRFCVSCGGRISTSGTLPALFLGRHAGGWHTCHCGSRGKMSVVRWTRST
jgi:hypothetical protein